MRTSDPSVDIIWGLAIAIFGVWLAVPAHRRSTNPVYTLLVARSRILWKDSVHRFHLFAGAACLAVGLLVATR